MAEFASLPLFTDAWIADTRHLSRAERGLYMDLLILCWRSPECHLKADIPLLARYLGCSRKEIPSLEKIISEFMSTDEVGIYQKRLLKEFQYTRDKRRKQTEKAKSRWNKETGDAAASQRHVPEPHERHMPEAELRHGSGNAPSPSPSPSPSPTQHSTKDLEHRLREAAGWEREPHPGLCVTGPIEALIAKGVDLEKDVLPVVKAKAAKAHSRTSWNFFVAAIVQAFEQRIGAGNKINGSAASVSKPIDWKTFTRTDYEGLVQNAVRRREWPKAWGPTSSIPSDLVTPELRNIIG